MPYQIITVHPNLVLTCDGVMIYSAYFDDDYDQPAPYHFVCQIGYTDTDSIHAFDVRTLGTPSSLALTTCQPKPFVTGDLAQAVAARHLWDTETEPALIILALQEAVRAGIIFKDY